MNCQSSYIFSEDSNLWPSVLNLHVTLNHYTTIPIVYRSALPVIFWISYDWFVFLIMPIRASPYSTSIFFYMYPFFVSLKIYCPFVNGHPKPWCTFLFSCQVVNTLGDDLSTIICRVCPFIGCNITVCSLWYLGASKIKKYLFPVLDQWL